MDMDWLEAADIDRKQRAEQELITMKYQWLVETVTELLPCCSFDEDNEGQIVIYTNVRRNSDDVLIDLEV